MPDSPDASTAYFKTPSLIEVHANLHPAVAEQAKVHNALETELASLDPANPDNARAIQEKTAAREEARRLFNVLGGHYAAKPQAPKPPPVHPFLKRFGITSISGGHATVGTPGVVEPVEQAESVEPAEINK